MTEMGRTAMQSIRHFGRLCALALVLFGMVGSAKATSANTDVSDIWWNPAESGWGMQMVNTGTYVFATVYVYGPNGSPTWYTAQLNKTGAAVTTYTGPLYVTAGPYFGGSFNPNAVTVRQAGTMTFVLTSVSTGQLNYSVDGVVVNKSVQRQPLTFDNYNGEYVTTLTQTSAGCSFPGDNGSFTSGLTVKIAQSGQSMTVDTKYADGSSCSFNGTYSQLGRMGQNSGSYACTWGEVGTMTFFEMNNVPYMFTARMQASSSNNGCNTEAELSGVIPR
jgi:hypothetical protein